MFERATVYSALLALILFSVLSFKYITFMQAKAQASTTSTSSQ